MHPQLGGASVLTCLIAYALLSISHSAAAPQEVYSELSVQDLVVVTYAHQPRLKLIEGSRSWRSGIRAIIFVEPRPGDAAWAQLNVTGAQHNEVYLTYPDDPPGKGRGPKAGDTRAALAPFLAVQYLEATKQTYKWMLYGDDDTMWFLHGVLRLLSGWDPLVAVAISDDYWPGHPNIDSFRCMPCQGALLDRLPPTLKSKTKPAFQTMSGCPCNATMYEQSGSASLGSPNGGAGIIFSHTVFNVLSVEAGMACVLAQPPNWSTGGDKLLSNCMWQQGPGFTDPGFVPYSRSPKLSVFGQAVQTRAREKWRGWPLRVHKIVQEPGCDAGCRFVIENMVSMHIRPGNFHQNMSLCAEGMHTMVRRHQLALEYLGIPQYRLRHSNRQHDSSQLTR